jgi:transcriptional regulator with XRE-family HTH domain
MKVKEQIRARREQLGISVIELAKRVGVSSQSVRHWEAGRSFPGKSKMSALEGALSFTLDWHEGAKPAVEQPKMAALIEQGDIDLLLLICRLPAPFKAILADLAKMHLSAIVGSKKDFAIKEEGGPKSPFNQKEESRPSGSTLETKTKSSSPRKKAPR